MVAQANYGGRVTDKQDERAIQTILMDFYTADILKPDYKFSPSGIYYSPTEDGNATLQSQLDFIKSLPISTTPETFWLHNNASLTALINEGLYITKTCVTMMSSFGASTSTDDDDEGGKQKTPEEIFAEIAADIVSRLPEPADVTLVIRKYPVKYDQCLNTVLHMELGKFNKLCVRLRSTCGDLGKAVKGLVVFSPDLEAVGNGCLTNKLPAPWMAVSYPSLKPLSSYVDDFIERWKFIQRWIANGIPYMFWFSAYFFQQAFLTGIKQNFARQDKGKISIDRVVENYKVMKMDFVPDSSPDRGAYMDGLFMDGARWDDSQMCVEDSFPKVLWSDMASIWLKPVVIEEDDRNYDKLYKCPIYKTSERKGVLSTSGHSSNFIMWLQIPHSCKPPHSEYFWTKRGVALISQTDD
jgi:dynein heavy chain